jgi:hypothetical protein
VAVTDHIRRRLYSAFTDQYGPELADALMELLPPSGWGDLVRAGDLAVTRSELRGEMGELRGEFRDLRAEMKSEIASVRTEVAELRVELKGDIANLRSEVGDLRVELKGEIADLREGQRSLLPKLVLAQVATSISVTGLALGAARFL